MPGLHAGSGSQRRSAPERAFVDTNILVYAEDTDAGEKHRIAKDLILRLWDSEEGCLSVQVLQEFFVTVTSKRSTPLAPGAALKAVEEYLTWSVVPNTPELLVDGIKLASSSRIVNPFRDQAR